MREIPDSASSISRLPRLQSARPPPYSYRQHPFPSSIQEADTAAAVPWPRPSNPASSRPSPHSSDCFSSSTSSAPVPQHAASRVPPHITRASSARPTSLASRSLVATYWTVAATVSRASQVTMDDDVEMDDEQEQEHDAVDDTVYDDPDADNDDMDDVDDDDDGDDDEEDDDGDEDDDDDDDDGDDDDDDDDDNEDADDDNDDASVAASGTGARRSAHEDALSAATYLRKVQERRNLFRPSPACVETTLGYQIEPMAAAPHSSHVHAMALSLDGQTLLTGGSDGFVRKYDVHATMNGKTMLTQNVRHGFVEGITRGGTLSAFWPHEEHPHTNGIASSSFPSASVAEKDRLVGVVHSLALQQDALWGVSGSESGNIHLYTLRHDPGVARHVFRKHKGAVSALALTEDETGMISGGWDRGVHQWDLNTGQIVRSFPGHAGQISGLSFRPHAPASARSPSPRQLNVSIHPSAAESSSTEKQPQDADDAGDAQRDAEQVKEAPGDAPTGQDADEQAAKSRPGEAQSKAAADSAQGDAGADADAASKSVTADAPAPEASAQDITTSAGDAPPQSAEASTPTTRPEPASDAAATDFAAKSASPGPSEATRVKTEPDPSAPSSSLGGGAADDPTEEELAFEAELNASLGMALDGSGGPRADGTRPDRVTLGANGTTAGGLMVAGADEDLDDDAGDDDLFGGSTPPVSAAKDARDSTRANGRDESDGDDSLFGDGDEDADGDADADADMDAEADADADEDGDDADGSSDEDMPLAGRAMVKNASSQSTLVAESESVPLSLPSSTVKDVKVSSPTAVVPDAGPKKTLPQPAFGGFSVSSSYSAPISSFSPSVMLSTSLSGQAILWDLRCPSYVTDGEARGVHSLGLPSKVPPWCQSAVFSSDGGSVFVGRRNECVDHWDLRSPKLVNTLRLPSGSGPVYALAAMPNSRHIVCGSYDNVRLWDTADTAQGKVPFKIVAGHHGANLSSVLVDSSCKFLLTASGDRGWMGTSTEAVIIHDIKPL
ncbi:hypothetical protein PANT_18d00077 [Moesziomyces antarcticus T-34]|uniref:Transcription factor spt8 beta-propeller domain-containing protein n=1 Tax=Pseudozyma antarctica (strain T-34) TaxID=1151754 RepID=M9MF22_PSEA3|nr:hypothetical protein PANT_18d00077 [Moesziomyces antarcticus T-34]